MKALSSPPSTTATHWHGSLKLHYVRVDSSTQLRHPYSQAPLRVQRSFYPEGAEVCHTVMLHTAGGVVGGDRLSIAADLEPGTHALLTSAAAAKIYRSNGQAALQSAYLELAANATLEWMPQETIVFEGADFCQQTHVELATGATWFGCDITRFGRTARGEAFLRGEWRSRTEVWQEGRPLWIDRQWLPGSEQRFYSPHALAGCPVVGTLALVGAAVDPSLVEEARSLWQGEGEAGVTRLQAGLLCRYRGHSTIGARRWFFAVWQLLRPQYLNRSACLPRVWQLEPNLSAAMPEA